MTHLLAQTSGMEDFAWKALQIIAQSAISGVIVGLVAWGAMKANMANVKKRQEEMGAALDRLSLQVSGVGNERRECELRSARTMATKAELTQVFAKLDAIGDKMGSRMEDFRRDIHGEIQGVHGRITEVAKSVARFQGEGE
jgi:hypothetical protein